MTVDEKASTARRTDTVHESINSWISRALRRQSVRHSNPHRTAISLSMCRRAGPSKLSQLKVVKFQLEVTTSSREIDRGQTTESASYSFAAFSSNICWNNLSYIILQVDKSHTRTSRCTCDIHAVSLVENNLAITSKDSAGQSERSPVGGVDPCTVPHRIASAPKIIRQVDQTGGSGTVKLPRLTGAQLNTEPWSSFSLAKHQPPFILCGTTPISFPSFSIPSLQLPTSPKSCSDFCCFRPRSWIPHIQKTAM